MTLAACADGVVGRYVGHAFVHGDASYLPHESCFCALHSGLHLVHRRNWPNSASETAAYAEGDVCVVSANVVASPPQPAGQGQPARSLPLRHARLGRTPTLQSQLNVIWRTTP